MTFIRENLFLLAMVAVVLIGGGVLLAMASGAAGDAEKRIEVRKSLIQSLPPLGRANEKVVGARIRFNLIKSLSAVKHLKWNWNRLHGIRFYIKQIQASSATALKIFNFNRIESRL